jgi:hypothetical protein
MVKKRLGPDLVASTDSELGTPQPVDKDGDRLSEPKNVGFVSEGIGKTGGPKVVRARDSHGNSLLLAADISRLVLLATIKSFLSWTKTVGRVSLGCLHTPAGARWQSDGR